MKKLFFLFGILLVFALSFFASAVQEKTLTGKAVSSLPSFLRIAEIDNTYSFEAPNFIKKKTNTNKSLYPEEIFNLSLFEEVYYTPEMGLELSGDPGMPLVPYKTARLLIPYGKSVDSVEVTAGEKIYLGKYNLAYGENYYKLSDFYENNIAPAVKNEEIYSSDSEYPGILNSGYDIQKLDGYSILIMNLFPLQYNAKTGEVYYYQDIRIRVYAYSLTSASSLSEATYLRADKDAERVRSIVDNPDKTRSYFSANTLLSIPSVGQKYDYIIITNSSFSQYSGANSFNTLVDWKRSRGLNATIVTTEEIYSDSRFYCDGLYGDGCARPEYNDSMAKIRNFIRYAYKNLSTKYILLGGDADRGSVGGESGNNVVPVRVFYPRLSAYTSNEIASDVYYSNLDGSFNSDNDAYFGEPNDGVGGGKPDLYAEVYVGRAPVDSYQEISNFVRKTIWYENYTMHQPNRYTDVDSYLKTAMMVGEHLGFGEPVEFGDNSKEEVRLGAAATGTIEANYTSAGFPDGYYYKNLYDGEREGCDNHYFPPSEPCWTTEDFLNNTAPGVHIINHLGHGSSNIVMKLCHNLGGDCTFCASSGRTDIYNLTNDKPFFAYSQACYPGAFDNSNYEGCYSKTDSIAENFVVKEHGAFAVIMNSRFGWGRLESTDGASQRYDREFWDAIYGEGKLHLGEANHDSKEDNIGAILNTTLSWHNPNLMLWVYYETNLLGDPETSLYLFPRMNHNVGVEKIISPKGALEIKTYYNFSVGVKNSGETDESAQITFKINNISIGSKVVFIAKNSTQIVNFSWYSAIGGEINISASAFIALDEFLQDNEARILAVVSPIKYIDSYSDYALDTNGDGLYDKIIFRADVDSIVDTNIDFYSTLYYNCSAKNMTFFPGYSNFYCYKNATTPGTFLANAIDSQSLNFGINTLEFPFETYGLVLNNISDKLHIFSIYAPYFYNDYDYLEISKLDVYNTSFYNYTYFDKIPAKFTRNFWDYVYDLDGDGKGDYLVVVAEINISRPIELSISHNIYQNGSLLSSGAINFNFSSAGLYNITFLVNGVAANLLNKTGGFNLTRISAEYSSYSYFTYTFDSISPLAYTTKNYQKDDFDSPNLTVNGFSESTIDLDSDGLYDYLVLNINVTATQDGLYNYYGTLNRQNNNTVAYINKRFYMHNGENIISFYIPGSSIRAISNSSIIESFRFLSAYLSSVEFSFVKLYDNLNPYNTSSYNNSKFEKDAPSYGRISLQAFTVPYYVNPDENFEISASVLNYLDDDSGLFNLSFYDSGKLLEKQTNLRIIGAYNQSTFSTSINLSRGIHELYVQIESNKTKYSSYGGEYLKKNIIVGNPFGATSSLFISTDKDSYNFGERVNLTR